LHANQGNKSSDFTFGREKQGRPVTVGKRFNAKTRNRKPGTVISLRPGALALKMNQRNTGNAPGGSGTNSWNDSAARSKKEEVLQQTRGLERKLLEEAAQKKAGQRPPVCPVCGHKLTRQTRDQERT
jgi:hypothetical protein